MVSCTDPVYILLLRSVLHLLHAPFRPKKKSTHFKVLYRWQEAKKQNIRAILDIIQNLIKFSCKEKWGMKNKTYFSFLSVSIFLQVEDYLQARSIVF